MSTPLILAALLLDLLLGDPRGWPHPVIAIGRLITRLETVAEKLLGRSREAGILLLVGTVSGSVLLAAVLLGLGAALHPWLEGVVALWLAYSALALRSLHQESATVIKALAADDLDGARQALAMIVGRDTANLDRDDILRACIETVAENSSDGVIAPLFYLLFGGPLLAIAFKAVSTLDSMVGYKDDRYRELGWASARCDDLVNFIPARLTALAIIVAALPLRLNGAGAWQAVRRDARKHTSPNAGYPEAAVAGAVGVQLGGSAVYFGREVVKPTLGDAVSPLSIAAYRQTVALMYLSTFLVVVGGLLLRSLL